MDCEKCFVLLIPTRQVCYDWEKTPANRAKICNISDNGKPLYVSALKQKNSNNIQIRHHYRRFFCKKIVCSINLECISATPYGLFLYKYKYDEENNDLAKLVNTIESRAIYQLVKEIYHSHEFHPKENDSILKPLNGSIDLSLPNNYAIEFFLKRFADYFSAKIKLDIKPNYENFLKLIRNKKLKGRSKILEFSNATRNNINDALGCFLYCKTLINSVDSEVSNYNESNIKNYVDSISTAISEIEDIQKIFLNEYSFISSHLSISLGDFSLKLAFLSIILGLIALPSACSSISAMFSKSESIDDLYKIQKTLLYNDSIQSKNIEKQSIQLDTIKKHVIQLKEKSKIIE